MKRGWSHVYHGLVQCFMCLTSEIEVGSDKCLDFSISDGHRLFLCIVSDQNHSHYLNAVIWLVRWSHETRLGTSYLIWLDTMFHVLGLVDLSLMHQIRWILWGNLIYGQRVLMFMCLTKIIFVISRMWFRFQEKTHKKVQPITNMACCNHVSCLWCWHWGLKQDECLDCFNLWLSHEF